MFCVESDVRGTWGSYTGTNKRISLRSMCGNILKYILTYFTLNVIELLTWVIQMYKSTTPIKNLWIILVFCVQGYTKDFENITDCGLK